LASKAQKELLDPLPWSAILPRLCGCCSKSPPRVWVRGGGKTRMWMRTTARPTTISRLPSGAEQAGNAALGWTGAPVV